MEDPRYGHAKLPETHTYARYSIGISVFGRVIFGVRGQGRRGMVYGAPPPHPNWNRGLTGLALGVCVCLGVG